MAKVAVHIDEKHFDEAAKAEIKSLKSKLRSAENKLARRDKNIRELEEVVRENILNINDDEVKKLQQAAYTLMAQIDSMNLSDASNFCYRDHSAECDDYF